MTDITRPEFEARIEAVEARMDARIGRIETRIDGFLAAQAERDKRLDAGFGHIGDRFNRLESDARETRQALGNLKYWMIGTGTAIVLGVATFNATVLSNMVVSFESGKDTGSSVASATQRLDAVAGRLDRIEGSRSAPPAAPKD